MKVFGEEKAEDFLEKKGFNVANKIIVKSEKELEKSVGKIKFPIVMKVSSEKIIHKADVSGVEIGIKNKEEMADAYKRLSKISKKVILQEFIEGQKVIVGLKKDPVFEHVLVFGLGGIFVEVIKDVSFRVCPVSEEDCNEMIKEIKSYELLKGIRGGKEINFKKLVEAMMLVSKLSQKHKNINELDINPLIVNEKDAVIVDAMIILE